MKMLWILTTLAGLTLLSANVMAAETVVAKGGMGQMMQGGMPQVVDDRESAGIPDPMKTRHLARMRNHLEAVHDIIDAMAHGEFGQAAATARQSLAMGPGMGKGMGQGKGMCKGMNNEEFKSLGMAFHTSAGKLAEVLEQGDMKASLNALSETTSYCIQCHAAYRQ